jgi:hypothetical protein
MGAIHLLVKYAWMSPPRKTSFGGREATEVWLYLSSVKPLLLTTWPWGTVGSRYTF